MPTTVTYQQRRGQLHEYFDRTASATWARLTSDAPVSGIRATVREGRRQMRELLLDWLPADLSGARLLDAGCGTGALAAEAAARGAEVVAIDLAGSLVEVARQRIDTSALRGSIQFEVGDFTDRRLGSFDYVVAMDSLIHYDATDIVRVLSELAPRTKSGMCITFAPRTPILALMHAVGVWFPRGDRAPAIVPVAEQRLRALVQADPVLSDFRAERCQRIGKGFYISQAMELRKQ
jgi:magnesium-protoporphyrin O-methyltransferase